MPQTEKFLTIDVGKAWTKVFLATISQDNSLGIERSSRLPSSHPNLSFSIKKLLEDFKEKTLSKTLLVSSLEKAQDLAKELGVDFVPEEAAAKQLVEFFKKSSEKISILDAGASNFDNAIDAKQIGKYLSFSISETNLENFLANKSKRPQHLPRNVKDLEIEEAFLRKVYEGKLQNESKQNLFLVITGGLLSDTPDVSRVALLLLDIFPENRIAQVVFDREFFLPSFGALLSSIPRLEMAVPGPWLDRLGTLVSLGGPKAIKLDWGFSQIQEIELSADEIAFVPAARDQRIQMQILTGKEKAKASVHGGSLGLVFDARTKPLQLSYGQESSRKKMASWFEEVKKFKNVKETF